MRPRRQPHGTDATTLAVGPPPALLAEPAHDASPVLRVVLDRVRSGSTPGARDDDHVVCLAIEGGGMRGAVSAGMCVVLEAAGVVPAFDRIYGVSAGALNACATAFGQAALSATHYQDAVSRGVVNRMRPLVRRPVIDFDLLFQDVIATHKPLAIESAPARPEPRALATSLETKTLRVLGGFADVDEMLQAIRASASLPRLGGEPPVFRGERMADGGLIEPIPVEAAIAEGATHVLVLRSRAAGYRKPALSELIEPIMLRDDPALAELLRSRNGIYNRMAAELGHGIAGRDRDVHVAQVAVPDGTRLVGRLESNAERVTGALRAGARAMAATILSDAVDLCWQPVVYRATTG